MQIWRPLNPPVNKRAIALAVTIAVAAHVAAFAWVAERRADPAATRPPALEGMNGNPVSVGGLPAAKQTALHQFKVLDGDSAEAPLYRARVTDLFGAEETWTNHFGMASLRARPAARFVIQIEKPGYAIHAEELRNIDSVAPVHTVLLKRQAIPYYVVDTIFYVRCTYCHGRVGTTEGVNLTTYERVVASSGKHGPSIRPFRPDSSPMFRVLADSFGTDGKRTPHARGTMQTTEFEIQTIFEWIREGAHRAK